MTSTTRLCTLAAIALAAWPANAADDPNAAVAAETARLNAETARINAEAALASAKAAKDKAAIEALGLPKFENKTELVEKGGAIETAMLSSRAVAVAAEIIAGKVRGHCTVAKPLPALAEAQTLPAQSPQAPFPQLNLLLSGKPKQEPIVVILAGNEKFDLNFGKTMLARIGYHRQLFNQAIPEPSKTAFSNFEFLSAPLIGGLVSAAAGLFGNDTTVSGVDLPEIEDHMLANSVAGALTPCPAILPSAGGGVADIENSTIAKELTALVGRRNVAARLLGQIPEKAKPAQNAQGEQLKAAIAEFDTFYKAIHTPEADGQTDYVRAILVENVSANPSAMLLRIAVNRAGGTITNSKNIGTFFGADPVRVSGGLVASFALVDAVDGRVKAAGSVACQTAQARLRNVQSGNWYSFDQDRNARRASAFCQ